MVAAGRAANHCKELLKLVDERAGEQASLDLFAKKVAPIIASAFGMREADVEPHPLERVDEKDFRETAKAGRCNRVLWLIPERISIVLSIDCSLLLSKFDRAFGGDGSVAKNVNAFSASVDRYSQKIEAMIERDLGEIIAPGVSDVWRVGERGTHFDTYPFAMGSDLLKIAFSIGAEKNEDWRLELVMQEKHTASLCDKRNKATKPAGPINPLKSPFRHVPLPVSASLASASITVGKLSRLTPGDVLPVSLNATVPLLLSGEEIARGTIGECDGRVALQVTHSIFGQ